MSRPPGADRIGLGVRPVDRQTGIALVTVLLVMTAVTLLGIATQELVHSNIRLEGARYQVRLARSVANVSMAVFKTLGRPRLAQLVPVASSFAPQVNLDLNGANLAPAIDRAQQLASASAPSGLVVPQNYSYNSSTRAPISVDYLGRSRVPPGNEPATLFPITINSGSFCADFFRIISLATTSGGARGGIDQNMYIVSPCVNF